LTLLPSLLLTAVVLAACGGKGIATPPPGSNAVTVDLGATVRLAPGQEVFYNRDGLLLRFETVEGDTRCPTGVQCIWPGEAKAVVTLRLRDGSLKTLALTEPGSAKQAVETFSGYRMAYHVEPHPEVGVLVPSEEYRLLLTVQK
jgi:hypothetical protein